MARIRSTHPGAPKDEDVATMSCWARLVWNYLPCHADRDGRLLDQPFRLKLEILPLDVVDMDAILAELAAKRHIIRYACPDGRKYIQIRSFARWQNPHKGEQSRGYPAPIGWDTVGQNPVTNGEAGKNSGEEVSKDGLPFLSSGQSVSQSAGDPDPRAPEKFWHAADWFRKFGIAWVEKYKTLTYRGTSLDAKFIRELGDILAAMPEKERLATQDYAQAMFSRYLGDSAPGRVKASHPWKWFVEDFNGLRANGARGSPLGTVDEETLANRRAWKEKTA